MSQEEATTRALCEDCVCDPEVEACWWNKFDRWANEGSHDKSNEEDQQQQEQEKEAEEKLDDLGPPPDPATPPESMILNEQKKLRSRRIASEREAEAEAAKLAGEWFGITGELFDPSTPEPVPFVLEYGVDDDGVVLCAFPEGVSFLFGSRGSLKTWLVYFAQLQELRKGNWVLILDYELSYEEALRRFHTLAEGTHEPLTVDQLRRLIYLQPSGPPSSAGKKELLKRFEGNVPTLLGIDSVGMGMGLSGLDENVSKDMIVWGKELVLWLKKEWPHTAIILIDHVPKSRPGAPEATDPIGTQRKGALASGLYFIATTSPINRKTRGSGRLTLRKSRQGHGDENAPLLDFEFGGGGPFTVGPADPNSIPLDLSSVAANELRIAVYVGEHEPAKVGETRKALHIGNDEFTWWADRLVKMEVIIHPPRRGLSKGPRWQEYIDNNGELDPVLD